MTTPDYNHEATTTKQVPQYSILKRVQYYTYMPTDYNVSWMVDKSDHKVNDLHDHNDKTTNSVMRPLSKSNGFMKNLQ